ncbi:hypothetical protein FZEAL_3503 [Fusarium zealandicum]|uniref:HNH nuclease domain-containing protein n=1 Tax=Fusarium zealandicum TaxID=1053134 RepID=A0A8H4UNN3_9HYPO|nr:hypothetical protein FZEAL_3503 [Fusarium zealandicum]
MLRDSIDEPALVLGNTKPRRPHSIAFVHPGYDRGHWKYHVLLSLLALDDGGIDYTTAHTACGILAGNRWDGFFSRDRAGDQRIEEPRDGVLRDERYFYHLPGSSPDQPYPILPRFSDWLFPHQALPPAWNILQHQMLLEVEEQGDRLDKGHCCLSNYADVVESAHLVPAAQAEWWSKNHISSYGTTNLFSTDPINFLANYIPLRSDVHKLFDERHFCFLPKKPRSTDADQGKAALVLRPGDSVPDTSQGDNGEAQGHTKKDSPSTPALQDTPWLVAHVFNNTTSGQLPKLWHNRRVHSMPSTVSVECLFARFAWTVFSPSIFRDFLYATQKSRRILIWNPEDLDHEVEEASPHRCRAIFDASRSRSESPKKRSRGNLNRQLEDQDWQRQNHGRESDNADSDRDSGSLLGQPDGALREYQAPWDSSKFEALVGLVLETLAVWPTDASKASLLCSQVTAPVRHWEDSGGGIID